MSAHAAVLVVRDAAVPARLHQSRETLEEAGVSFLFQVIEHFLGKERGASINPPCSPNSELIWWVDGHGWTGENEDGAAPGEVS